MAERILMTNGKLKVTDNPIIPFIEGDLSEADKEQGGEECSSNF